MQSDDAAGPVDRSARAGALALIAAFVGSILVLALLSGMLDPVLAWLSTWAGVVQALGGLALSGALVYLYYRQQAIARTQATIMDRQGSLMESQYYPSLFEHGWEWSTDAPPYYCMTELRNESDRHARQLYLRFEAFVERADVHGAAAVRAQSHPTRSTDAVYSLTDLVFTRDALVETVGTGPRTITAPVTITDEPGLLTTQATSSLEHAQPVSKVGGGEAVVLSAEVWHRITSQAAPDETALHDMLPFEQLATYLHDCGIETLHVWIGVVYLDRLRTPHSLTLRTRTLDVSKRHYAERPFEEWTAPAARDVAALREDDPHHPDLTGDG